MKHTRATAVLLAASAAFVVGTGSAAHAEEPPVNVPLIGTLPDLGDMALGDAAPQVDDATKQLDGNALGLGQLPLIGELLGGLGK